MGLNKNSLKFMSMGRINILIQFESYALLGCVLIALLFHLPNFQLLPCLLLLFPSSHTTNEPIPDLSRHFPHPPSLPIWHDDLLVQLAHNLMELCPQTVVSEQFFPHHIGDLYLDAGYAQQDRLLCHSVDFWVLPVAPKEWIGGLELRFVVAELKTTEDVFFPGEEVLYFLSEWVVFPMRSNAVSADIDLAVHVTIELAVDIDMQQSLLGVTEGPVVEGLVEGGVGEVLGHEVVGVHVVVVDEVGHSPHYVRVVPRVPRHVGSQEGGVDLSEVDAVALVVLLASPVELLGVRGSEQDGPFSHAADVLVLEVVLARLGVHHQNYQLSSLAPYFYTQLIPESQRKDSPITENILSPLFQRFVVIQEIIWIHIRSGLTVGKLGGPIGTFS